MKKRVGLWLGFSLCLSVFAFAQSELPEGFGDYRTIENAEPGKTYTQAYVPPTFKKVVWRDSVLLLENNRHLLTNLTEGRDYEIITEIVETRPAYTVWKFETPKIDTIIETKMIIVDRICEEIEPMPKFENQVIIERKVILEAETAFLNIAQTKRFRNRCGHIFSKIPNAQIFVYALIEIPACYVSIEKRVFRKEGKWWTETIADTLIAKRKNYVLSGNLKSETRQIPAIVDTFRSIILYEEVLNQLVNPNFSTIKKQIIHEPTYFTNWKELYCGTYCPSGGSIREIQEALVKKGYDVEVNNILDKKTKVALIQFQKDNNLQIGQLSAETLKMLGVENFEE